eukprot:m.89768 g.89768  ORF g.89768 m.89768 type:complete len:759 (-) comp13673_c1_seq1:46-2322(-)
MSMDDFACRGWLTKQGKKVKSWKRRYFVLGEDANLTYYDDDRASHAHLGVVDMHTATAVRLGSECEWKDNKAVHEAVRIEIVVPGRQYQIFADTPAMASEWAKKLRAACESSKLDVSKQPDGATRQLNFMRDAGTRLKGAGALRQVGARTSMFPTPAEREASSVIISGWLYKSGGKVRNWKKRFFVLSVDGTLCYYLGEDVKLAPLGTVFMDTVTSLCFPSDNKWPELPAFARQAALMALSTDARTYYLLADAPDTAATWLAKLKAQTQTEADAEKEDKDILGATKDDEDEDEDDGTEVDTKDDVTVDQEVDSFFGFSRIPRTRERRNILMDALRIRNEATGARTLITVIYNPVSGAGTARKIAEQTVVPVLRLAGLEVLVVPTTHRGFATSYAASMDLKVSNTIVICGGDGLVSEVITGLMNRGPDIKEQVFVGIVPSGTANAMANELDGYVATSHVHLTGRAALGVAAGTWREVDVLRVAMADRTIYGLSCIGWGLAGAVAQTADRLRWLPGQRKARYDIAGFVTMMSDWPLKCDCELLFPPDAIAVVPQTDKADRKSRASVTDSPSPRKDSAASDTQAAAASDAAASATDASSTTPASTPAPTTPPSSAPALGTAARGPASSEGWERIGPLNVLNFIASNVPRLGKDHPMNPEIAIDDGRLVVTWIDASHTRMQLANAALSMKQGKYLSYHPMMTARIATEFKCVPVLSTDKDKDKKGDVPYNIDGDPVPPQPMHATILNRALRVFYCPEKFGKP